MNTVWWIIIGIFAWLILGFCAAVITIDELDSAKEQLGTSAVCVLFGPIALLTICLLYFVILPIKFRKFLSRRKRSKRND